MLANLRRYLRKRPGSAAPLSPDARFLTLTGLLAVGLVGVIAILWSAL
jgi:hypothetical protein